MQYLLVNMLLLQYVLMYLRGSMVLKLSKTSLVTKLEYYYFMQPAKQICNPRLHITVNVLIAFYIRVHLCNIFRDVALLACYPSFIQ